MLEKQRSREQERYTLLKVFVSSVDTILSEKPVVQNYGFVQDLARLNLGMTRAISSEVEYLSCIQMTPVQVWYGPPISRPVV